MKKLHDSVILRAICRLLNQFYMDLYVFRYKMRSKGQIWKNEHTLIFSVCFLLSKGGQKSIDKRSGQGGQKPIVNITTEKR